MRQVVIISLLTISLKAYSATFYIDPAGRDLVANNGSRGSPWLTLAYACSRVTTPGDIIHVNAGTYIEYYQSNLAVGVSIEGEGETSVISSFVSKEYFATIYLHSSVEGTNGNQHISNLKMDGNNLTAWNPITVHARSNVSIHDLYIIDFKDSGVIFNGTYLNTEPIKYSTGNLFYNNRVINCSDYFGSKIYGEGRGALKIGGQEGMLIYNNELTQTQRGPGDNGYLIKFSADGYNKGIKIYNNKITKAPYDGITWDFAIELWNCRGGIEINNNTIIGAIDFGGNSTIKGPYLFAVDIHHNTIGQNTLQPLDESGIIIEKTQTGPFIIRNNYFKNLGHPLLFYPYSEDVVENIYIYNNIFNTIGILGEKNYGNGMWWASMDKKPPIIKNINFINNIFIAGTAGNPNNAIIAPNIGKATNIKIKNNIIQGFAAYPVYAAGQGVSIDSIDIENNIFYNNNINYPKFDLITVTNNITKNNIVGNPLFVSSSDFRLQPGSPAIGKGLKITDIITDFEGNSYKDPPSIGAFEYNSNPPVPIVPVYQSSEIKNLTPNLLEMTYNVTLADSIPDISAFTVRVNGEIKAIKSDSISGNKIMLTLAQPVQYNNVINISYTPPPKQPIQTPSLGFAATITSQPVTNRLLNPTVNVPPNVQADYAPEAYSGKIYKLDASKTSDPNNDALTFSWVPPVNVPVSSITGQIISFLAPVVNKQSVITFSLNVSDGNATKSMTIPITILPYKPELSEARIAGIEASSYLGHNIPQNIDDGKPETMWSVDGDNQWLLFKLGVPYKISHLMLSFLPEQKYESYFDIYASDDSSFWEPILIKAASCKFSGNMQIFDFPASKTSSEYSYIKLVGHGTANNNLNSFSEFKVFGNLERNIAFSEIEKKNVVVYPNPALDYFNISIEESTLKPDRVRVVDYSGRIIFEDPIEASGINYVPIPSYVNSGAYIVELLSGSLILDTHILIIRKSGNK